MTGAIVNGAIISLSAIVTVINDEKRYDYRRLSFNFIRRRISRLLYDSEDVEWSGRHVVPFRFSRESTIELANSHEDVIVSMAHIAKFMLLLWKRRVQCRLYFYIFSSVSQRCRNWMELFRSGEINFYKIEFSVRKEGWFFWKETFQNLFIPLVPLLIVGLLSFSGITRGRFLQSNLRRECYLWQTVGANAK